MNPEQNVRKNVTVTAWDGERGPERHLVVNAVVLEVDVVAHDGGAEGGCAQEAVVVGLVACQMDHRHHVFEPHAKNSKIPSKTSISTRGLGIMAGKKKVEEAEWVSET